MKKNSCSSTYKTVSESALPVKTENSCSRTYNTLSEAELSVKTEISSRICSDGKDKETASEPSTGTTEINSNKSEGQTILTMQPEKDEHDLDIHFVPSYKISNEDEVQIKGTNETGGKLLSAVEKSIHSDEISHNNTDLQSITSSANTDLQSITSSADNTELQCITSSANNTDLQSATSSATCNSSSDTVRTDKHQYQLTSGRELACIALSSQSNLNGKFRHCSISLETAIAIDVYNPKLDSKQNTGNTYTSISKYVRYHLSYYNSSIMLKLEELALVNDFVSGRNVNQYRSLEINLKDSLTLKQLLNLNVDMNDTKDYYGSNRVYHVYPAVVRVEPDYGNNQDIGDIDPNGLIEIYDDDMSVEDLIDVRRPSQNGNVVLQNQAQRISSLDPVHPIAVSGRSTNIVSTARVQEQSEQSSTSAFQTEATSTVMRVEDRMNAPNNHIVPANANLLLQFSSSIATISPPLPHVRCSDNAVGGNQTPEQENGLITGMANTCTGINSCTCRSHIMHPQRSPTDEDAHKGNANFQTSRNASSSGVTIPGETAAATQTQVTTQLPKGDRSTSVTSTSSSTQNVISEPGAGLATSTGSTGHQTSTTTSPSFTSGSTGVSRNTTEGSEASRSSPKYPQFADVRIRVNTYICWPSHLDQLPRTMAMAGFFYTGYGDYTRCFFCGCGLKNWEAGDDPWVEHARWFPNCAFLRQKKGDSFVNDVHARHREILEQTSRENGREESSSINKVSPVVKQELREMGFDEHTLHQAVERLKVDRGKRGQEVNLEELTTAAICDVILQIEDESTFQASSNHDQATNSQESSQISTSTALDIARENEELKMLMMCRICKDEPVAIVFLPCSHLLCCEDCAQGRRKCPVCQENVKRTRLVKIALNSFKLCS